MKKPAVVAAAVALLLVTGAQGVAAGRFLAPGQIRALIRADVKASRAQVKVLAVDVHRARFRLVVSVGDPAAYLKHRYERVVEAIYPRLGRRVFRFVYLRVVDARSDRAVFSFSDLPSPGGAGRETWWHVDPKLADCATALLLPDYELGPDLAAPPCPAR